MRRRRLLVVHVTGERGMKGNSHKSVQLVTSVYE